MELVGEEAVVELRIFAMGIEGCFAAFAPTSPAHSQDLYGSGSSPSSEALAPA
ncbi:hypothetical protein OS128_12045 [Corynebacterium sp. P5848]|uniref:hypothetical protein n=1 Tax=Corynebacterium marambiense TaxID=2765364 RepID=UPI002260E775|nr:hypothetical protein [Corynebacterium marambiense]MCX7543638.1 hypothetical protein [Corynebacterium marambiense]